MNQIPVFHKAISDTIADSSGVPRRIYLFGLPQPDGGLVQVLACEGMATVMIEDPNKILDVAALIVGGFDIFTAAIVINKMIEWDKNFRTAGNPPPAEDRLMEGN
jgi:hypothetical protein